MTLAPYLVVPAVGDEPYVTILTDVQADGRACARCRTNGVPMVPVGRCYPVDHCVLRGGVQVFLCPSCEVVS